ncbi:MAG: FecR family protein [Gemmatimonadota bacterium]|nr:FecR family protein [Gemmatimonadota bacterium]
MINFPFRFSVGHACGRRLAVAGGMLLTCVTAACPQPTTTSPRYGSLDAVLVAGANAESPSSEELRIARPSGMASNTVGMEIRKSDTISTSRKTRAVMTLLESYEVTLDTGTIIIIENPSVFVRLGQLFIRKLTGSRDSMVVHTKHSTILDKGTSFFVRVPREDSSQVFVAEGAVSVTSRSGVVWPRMTYAAGEGGTFVGARAPIRMRVAPAALSVELSWVQRVDSVKRIRRSLIDPRYETPSQPVVRQPSPVEGYPTPVTRPPTRGEAVTTRICRVPDIINRPETEALKLITAAGYVARRRGDSGDYVATQSPERNSSAPCGESMTYTMTTRVRY